MLPLTGDVQNLMVVATVVCMVPFLALTVSALLMRQLRYIGYMDFESD